MSVTFLFAHKNVKTVEDAITHLEGGRVWRFFDEKAVAFVTKFSAMLLKYPSINEYPDLVALAYWFRRAGIKKLAKNYENEAEFYRVGRGVALHIAPSNVDTIFVYSFFLSLLAGNTSFIRVSENGSPQLDIIVQIFRELYDSGDNVAAERFIICTYPHEEQATTEVSKRCELRVIWGGNETVKTITSIPLNPTASELKFPNRTSFAAISEPALAKISDKELAKVCQRFYTDIKLFGQQACSSPLALYFIGSSGPSDQHARFCRFFHAASQGHQLSASEVMGRYVSASSLAISGLVGRSEMRFSHDQVLLLDGISSPHGSFRDEHPGNGSIVQFFLPQLADLAKYVKPEDQTLSVYGFEPEELTALISSIGNRGVDRVVPIGQALEFSNIWDGIDLLDSMSRKIDLSRLYR